MNKTIAVLAPITIEKQNNLDLILRLKPDNRELTIQNLYELIKKNYDITGLREIKSYSDITVPASGYYLTSRLREKNYNAVLLRNTDDISLGQLHTLNPIAICISTTMIYNKETLQYIVNRIRNKAPGVPIIAGGVFIFNSWLFNKYFNSLSGKKEYLDKIEKYMIFPCSKKQIDIDYMIISRHGFDTLIKLLEEIEKPKKDFEKINNIACPDNKGIFRATQITNETIDYNEDFTKWNLLDDIPERIPLRTSIGCPYRCGYCNFCYLYPDLFLRSGESIKKELTLINNALASKNRISLIHVVDDNVFINKKRIDEITSVFKKSNVKAWAGFMRADSISKDNIRKIKDSGLFYAYAGVETGDEKLLKIMNKNIKLESIKNGIELLDRSGITVLMTYLVGYPGENDKTIQNTINFINSLDIGSSSPSVQLYPLIVMPLSEISMQESRNKWELKGFMKEWSHKTMDYRESIVKAYEIFKNIDVSYHYNDESIYFNRRFKENDLRELFKLRNRLTTLVIDGENPEKIKDIFIKIAVCMDLDQNSPPSKVIDQIIIPEIFE